MKKIISLLLCLALALALCACGSEPVKEAEKPANMQSSLPGTSAVEEEPEETEAPVSAEESAAQAAVLQARKLKNRPVSELIAIIGEPVSEDAAPSCMGPGEDVNLYYEGFTVYTYREGDSQIVVDAEVSK